MSGTDDDRNRSSHLGREPDFRATMTRREEILDRKLSDVLPDHASRRMKNFPVLGPSGEILGFGRLLKMRGSSARCRGGWGWCWPASTVPA